MIKLLKFSNGTKVPDFPITIGTSITARVQTTDWHQSLHSTMSSKYHPTKAFDENFGTYFVTAGQDKQAMVITFDKPEVNLSI